jgi:hypothetical protein
MSARHALRVFYSYSHADEQLRQRLEKHLALLRRQGIVIEWHDHKIEAGTEWAGQISDQLEQADVILLLVSADFLASDYCYEIEMKRAVERHAAGHARVIPVILRPCDWHSAVFGKLQALPRNAEPITTWKDEDQGFADVARGLRAIATGETALLPVTDFGHIDPPSRARPPQREASHIPQGLADALARFVPVATPPDVEIQLWTQPHVMQIVNRDISIELEDVGQWKIGDIIRLCARVNRDCYLSLINIGTSGNISVLLPNRLHTESIVRSGEVVAFPDIRDTFKYRLKGPVGSEKVIAIAASVPLRLAPDDFAQGGNFTAPTTRDIEVVADNVSAYILGRTQIEFAVIE